MSEKMERIVWKSDSEKCVVSVIFTGRKRNVWEGDNEMRTYEEIFDEQKTRYCKTFNGLGGSYEFNKKT